MPAPHGAVPADEEHAALATVAAEVMTRACPPAVVRAAWDGAAGSSDDVAGVWAVLAGAGLTGVAVPEIHGGIGLGVPGLAIVAEAAGRVALPLPLVETAVAALAVDELGTAEQQARWLPAVAAGDARGAVAIDVSPGPATGSSLGLVPFAGTADFLVHVTADQARLLERDEYVATRRSSSDRARPVYGVQPRPGAGTELSWDPAAGRRILDQAAVATAAVLCGLSARLLAVTIEYVTARRQFGQPVGAFQAIKHRLADAGVAAALTWPAVWDAATALSAHAADASLRVSVAKAFASDAAAIVNDHALQCHGGIGFSWEYDLHLWLKRGKALERVYGTAREHRWRIGRQLFAGTSSQG